MRPSIATRPKRRATESRNRSERGIPPAIVRQLVVNFPSQSTNLAITLMSAMVRFGKVVSVTYRITDGPEGDILEQIDVPVDYLHGHDSGLFDKVEKALEGCRVGDSVVVSLTADEAFGPHHAEMLFSDHLENAPPEVRYIGAEVEFEGPDGGKLLMRVTDINHDTITLDGNHPFAGRDITFHVNIVAIRDADLREMREGVQRPDINQLH
jgi:FKBP-type peptidyl-prolyl cis-trans isomerase SlyD